MTGNKKKYRWIKLAIILVFLLCLGGAALRFLPFPWYVHEELPMAYFQSTDDVDYETGLMEVNGWMLCYLFKPDRFYGTVETIMEKATFGHREYKAKMTVTFDKEPVPDQKLAKGWRYVHIDKIDCDGDIQSFINYWYDENRSPIVKGRFKGVVLQQTYSRSTGDLLHELCVCPGTSAWTGQKTWEDFLKENPSYPVLPLE